MLTKLRRRLSAGRGPVLALAGLSPLGAGYLDGTFFAQTLSEMPDKLQPKT
jgi:hypothetical protein